MQNTTSQIVMENNTLKTNVKKIKTGPQNFPINLGNGASSNT